MDYSTVQYSTYGAVLSWVVFIPTIVRSFIGVGVAIHVHIMALALETTNNLRSTRT